MRKEILPSLFDHEFSTSGGTKEGQICSLQDDTREGVTNWYTITTTEKRDYKKQGEGRRHRAAKYDAIAFVRHLKAR